MTEFEIGEMLHRQYDIMTDASVMYFTLVSAYLIAGYMVGDKLSRPQLTIVTSLYVLWVIGTINTVYKSLGSVIPLQQGLEQMQSILINASIDETSLSVYAFMLVQVAGVLGSLYFLWSVRNAKPG